MKKIIIGIDISSKTLDFCVKVGQEVKHQVIKNEISSIQKFFKKYSRQENVVVAMENTGRYNWNLYEVLSGFTFKVYVIAPLHLKKSLGLARGKNDQVDALRICSFIEKNQEETTLWKPAPVVIRKLKVLLTERTLRIKMRRQMVRQQQDYKLMRSLSLDKNLLKLNKKMVDRIDAQIKELEVEIEENIQHDDQLKVQAALIRSVPGVGKVVCWMMLAKTVGFSTINDPRKMACYCGVVPFDFQSGTSIWHKPRVSVFADKTMKSVLHLAAMTAIRLNNDLSVYYKRKVGEGKNKMSVLNAVRNKIIHRIFAVIKNQNMYKTDLILS